MANKISPERFTKIYMSIWGICLLVIFIGIVLYKFGFRVTNQLQPVRVSSIELSSNVENFQVFINNRERVISPKNTSYVLPNITPGVHSIIASKDGYWPWGKTVSVANATPRKLYAFMFPMNGLSTKEVLKNSSGYQTAIKKINGVISPEPKQGAREMQDTDSYISWLESEVPNFKLSADKSTALYAENNTVYVVWVSNIDPTPHYFCQENPCKLSMPVIVATSKVKSIDFYKDRPDLIIFASGGTIYAIEVDREGTQNFQPIYKGVDPYFYQDPSGILYIRDGNSIFRADL